MEIGDLVKNTLTNEHGFIRRKLVPSGLLEVVATNGGTRTYPDPNVTTIEWGKIQGPMTWNDAKKLETGEWRLPSVIELAGLYDYESDKPYDPNMPDEGFWSSSYAANSRYAWYVYFNNGFVSNCFKNNTYFVRCVREVKAQ